MNNAVILRRFLDICENNDYQQAIDLQTTINTQIPGKADIKPIRNICGLDISFDKGSDNVFAAVSVHGFPELEIIEQKSLETKTRFPYIPGLLAFREGPAIIELLRKLDSGVDLMLFDGHGIAHPRGAGIASMIGLMMDIRSAGCAKTKLTGEFAEPGRRKGSISKLMFKGRHIGNVVRTRDNIKPVFVSAGYKIDLSSVTDMVLRCAPKFRVPEPIRQAHMLSNSLRSG